MAKEKRNEPIKNKDQVAQDNANQWYRVVQITAYRGIPIVIRHVFVGGKNYFEYFFEYQKELFTGFVEVEPEGYETEAPYTKERLKKRIMAMAEIDEDDVVTVKVKDLIRDYRRLVNVTDKYRRGKTLSDAEIEECAALVRSSAMESIRNLQDKNERIKTQLSESDEKNISDLIKKKKK